MQKEDTSIDIGEYLKELGENLKNTFPSDGVVPTIHLQTDKIKLDGESAVRIGLIINELVTNSFKYAFAEQPNPRIDILLKRTDEDYQLTYQDNGKGLPMEIEIFQLKSLGLKLIHTLTKQLKGTMHTEKRDGAFFQFNFKDQKIAV